MLGAQDVVSREVVAAVREFLGGPQQDGDGWTFAFGQHLESTWGGIYGGALAASAVSAARCVAPDRSPRSLHIQFVRNVRRGQANATAEVRHLGRTVATVEVEFFDGRGKLAAIALVTMIDPASVEVTLHDTSAGDQVIGSRPGPPEAQEAGSITPIAHALGTFRPDLYFIENGATGIGGHPPYLLFATVPWDDPGYTGPESACLIADMANGIPIFAQYHDAKISFPNTDLSLRFTTALATRDITATGTLVSMQHGTATTSIEVRAGDHQLAHGLSASVLMPISPYG